MESELLEELEAWRWRMCALAAERDLLDPEVLRISEQLDQLINEFYALHPEVGVDAA